MKTIIVGGVAGGAGAAARLRRNDESAQIVLLEKNEHISFANCGLPYYVGGVIEEQRDLLLQTPKSFAAQFNVEVRTRHECLSVNAVEKTIEVKNRNTGQIYIEEYDKLILSPGARPVVPAIFEGAENLFTLRNIPDALAIRQYIQERGVRTCAVIGGGFIGLEMAENLKQNGLRVNVVEAADHVIGPLDNDMAYDVHNYLRAKGIGLYLGATAAKLEAGKLKLTCGREIDADIVILSVGVRPETSFLEGSGIVLGKRGEIIVNEYLETSSPDVYALGDAIAVRSVVTGKNKMIPLASPANRQARLVADNVCGMARKYSGSQGTAIIKLFDLTVAVTGESEASLLADGTPYIKSITYSPSNAGYYPGGQMMSVKLLFSPANGRLLGAQITGGKGADKRIDVLASALRAKMTAIDLQDLELAYAPPFSSAKDPVNMAGYVAENILRGKSQPVYVEEMDALPGNVALIDVRTPKEFEQGAIPGSVNLPLSQLRDRLAELDRCQDIIAICRIGQRGYNAEQILKQKGFRVRNLAGGYRLYQARQNDRHASP